MQIRAQLLIDDARTAGPPPSSVHLVVTSPPYPMVEMWDGGFRAMSPIAAAALDDGDGPAAFEAMHAELDRVWVRCAAALAPGGIACVNIGDAVRTLGGDFQLYPNHARILLGATRAGLTPLPDVLWRKPTNAPNKFMGSGMLPGGAYVTYEHEYVLILRKGGKRTFSRPSEQENRRRSAYFWEERNRWFSDLWQDLPGTNQRLGPGRSRSAAFPLELAARLISMYSTYGDVVLDPFAGTGTTLLAAAAQGRSAIGIELDPALAPVVGALMATAPEVGRARAAARLAAHAAFAVDREASGRPLKHHNEPHDVPVVTAQERSLALLAPRSVQANDQGWSLEIGPL